MIVLVTGVAGSGKTTVGEALAEELGWDFIEGDALHPPANVEKMRSGTPLDDHDRAPWLRAIRREMERRLERRGEAAVIAASALKQAYRNRLLVQHPGVLLVFIDITPELARERLGTREDHFFSPDLAASQFDVLEPPSEALVLPATDPVDELVHRIVRRVRELDAPGS